MPAQYLFKTEQSLHTIRGSLSVDWIPDPIKYKSNELLWGGFASYGTEYPSYFQWKEFPISNVIGLQK